jgi:hypothetical protein
MSCPWAIKLFSATTIVAANIQVDVFIDPADQAAREFYPCSTATASTTRTSRSGTIRGGTIHSVRRNCGTECSLHFCGGSARDPQSPIDAVGNCGDQRCYTGASAIASTETPQAMPNAREPSHPVRPMRKRWLLPLKGRMLGTASRQRRCGALCEGTVACAISTSAMDTLESVARPKPDEREAQLMPLRARVEACADGKYWAAKFEGTPPGIILRGIDFGDRG